MPVREHLATLIDDMRRLGAQTAVVEHRGVRRFVTSYTQLASGADWFAAELARRAIKPGDRVVLWGQNSAAWIACFFGCVQRGVLVVPLDATGTVPFAQRILHQTTPRLIVGDQVLLYTLGPSPLYLDLAELDEAMRRPAPLLHPEQPPVRVTLSPETPLQILFTSGTTGDPKGIVHTHRNLLASLTPIEQEIEKYRRYERVVHPLRFLLTLPLSHAFGQFMGLWIAPILGAVVHHESRLEAGRLLRLARQERISVLVAVPRVLALLRTHLLAAHPALVAQLAQAEGAPIWKRWWRFRSMHRLLGYRFWAMVCGGATLPTELESFWNTLGIALIQGYGMTETAALVTLNHPFKPARGTLGAPLPGRELRISDDGELLVRGEMVATTVWQDGELRKAAPDGSAEGWLATGDLTRRDDQGRLHYLGRTGQRLVTSAGLNVYLEDLEAALAAQPGIDAAVAVVLEGPQGAAPGAVLWAAELALAAQAVSAANARLASHQRIVRWWLWPELDLPRTATGKVRRHAVQAWVEEQIQSESEQDPSSQPSASQEESVSAVERGPGLQGSAHAQSESHFDPLLRLIFRVTGAQAGRTPPGSPQKEQSIESLGIDSLGLVQLQLALENASGRTIDDSEMTGARTLDDLRRLAGLPSPTTGSVPALKAPSVESSPLPGAHAAVKDAGSFLYLHWPWSLPVQCMRILFIEACVRPLVWLLANPGVSYAAHDGSMLPIHKNSPGTEPMLIVANHVSAFDLPLLLYALPPHLRRRLATATAGEMLEDWRHARGNPLGPAVFWLLTLFFNVFPLPRSHAFRRAFSHAGEALDHGFSVLIFPEGARSHGAAMQHFRGGIGLLAQQASVQILPIALRPSRSDTKWKRRLRPYSASISVGDPIIVEAGAEPRAITARLEEAVRALLGP